MGYFKWRGGFFYRVWHLNAKYYSNSTTTVRSFRVCPYPSYLILYLSVSLFLSFSLSFSRRYSCVSRLCDVVHGAPHGTRSFISWYSNALKHHTRPTRRRQCTVHGGATATVSARIKSHERRSRCVRHRDNLWLLFALSLLPCLVRGASKNADSRGSAKMKS